MTVRLRSILDFLIVTEVAILVTSAVGWYPQLPDRIVIHLNAQGAPNGWASKSILIWGLLPVIGVVITIGLQALVRWLEGSAARNPVGINMPQREAFHALPEEGRRMALAPVATYLRYTTVLLLALFIYIEEGLGRVSTGASSTWSSIPVFVFVLAVFAGIPFLLRSTNKAIHAFRSGYPNDRGASTSS